MLKQLWLLFLSNLSFKIYPPSIYKSIYLKLADSCPVDDKFFPK